MYNTYLNFLLFHLVILQVGMYYKATLKNLFMICYKGIHGNMIHNS